MERGVDFIYWMWEPVEGATGYNTRIYLNDSKGPEWGSVQDNSVMLDGLPPNSAAELFVQATKELGDRSLSEGAMDMTMLMGDPRERTVERDHALNHREASLPASGWGSRSSSTSKRLPYRMVSGRTRSTFSPPWNDCPIGSRSRSVIRSSRLGHKSISPHKIAARSGTGGNRG